LVSLFLPKHQRKNLTNVCPSTGYSFWNRLLNFLHKFTRIVLSVHK
jgi:hypothetical protein